MPEGFLVYPLHLPGKTPTPEGGIEHGLIYEFFGLFPRPSWERVRVRGENSIVRRHPLTPALSHGGERAGVRVLSYGIEC